MCRPALVLALGSAQVRHVGHRPKATRGGARGSLVHTILEQVANEDPRGDRDTACVLGEAVINRRV